MWPQAASRSPSADKPRMQPEQTTVGTQRPQKRFFRKGKPTACTPNQQPRLADALPSPPPLPAGKESESPSVVRGAGRAAYGLSSCPLPGAWGRSKGIKGSLRRDPHPFGARPCRAALRVRLPVAPLTPFPLQQPNMPSGSAPAAYRGRFRGLAYPRHPKAGKRAVGPFLRR